MSVSSVFIRVQNEPRVVAFFGRNGKEAVFNCGDINPIIGGSISHFRQNSGIEARNRTALEEFVIGHQAQVVYRIICAVDCKSVVCVQAGKRGVRAADIYIERKTVAVENSSTVGCDRLNTRRGRRDKSARLIYGNHIAQACAARRRISHNERSCAACQTVNRERRTRLCADNARTVKAAGKCNCRGVDCNGIIIFPSVVVAVIGKRVAAACYG